MISLLAATRWNGPFIFGEAFGKTDGIAETHDHAENFKK